MKGSCEMKLRLFAIIAALMLSVGGHAQTGPEYKQPEGGVPVVTGFVGLGTSFQSGQEQVFPTIAPIFLLPLGGRFLIEAEPEFEGTYTHTSGKPWKREWEKGIEYAQLDFFANRYVTIVGGRFLTPFGIFNERLHSGWIRNIQTEPFIAGLEATDSNGVQIRGGVPAGKYLNVNYAAFYSFPSDTNWFLATRATGGRVGFFFPKARLEVGTSFQRTLEGNRVNTYGIDWTWQSTRIPLDIRGEFARNANLGSGYWIEGAYRMSKVHFLEKVMRKSQAELRMEQYFTPAAGTSSGAGELPDVNTRRVFAGWSYWIRPDVRANFAYGRQFNADGDRNLWTAGLTYRFAFPLIGGKK